MAPIIELSEDYLSKLNSEEYTRRYDLEKGLEAKLQNSEGNKKDILTKYFSIPDQNGCFDVNYESDGNKFYKIEYKEHSHSGQLFYISGELDERAIVGIEHYLSPVCEIKNFSDRVKANKIKLIEPGEVYLSNNKWAINPNKKVKIKLI